MIITRKATEINDADFCLKRAWQNRRRRYAIIIDIWHKTLIHLPGMIAFLKFRRFAGCAARRRYDSYRRLR